MEKWGHEVVGCSSVPVPLVRWCVDDVAETDGEDVAGARTTLPGLWRTASWAEPPRYLPSYGSICTSSPSTTAVLRLISTREASSIVNAPPRPGTQRAPPR